MCPQYCGKLCLYHKNDTFLKSLLYYPGLNKKEIEAVKKYPYMAVLAWIQKERAEYVTHTLFPDSQFNDESDAFRHFLWAGLLTTHVGQTIAETFLNAHESTYGQPKAERAMDLANNSKGILAAIRMNKNGKAKLSDIANEALNQLHLGNLVVLQPGRKVPKKYK